MGPFDESLNGMSFSRRCPRYAGRDATRVFDIYGHSQWAHTFMRRHLLVFDAPGFVGRVGAPLCTTAAYRRWRRGGGVPGTYLRYGSAKQRFFASLARGTGGSGGGAARLAWGGGAVGAAARGAAAGALAAAVTAAVTAAREGSARFKRLRATGLSGWLLRAAARVGGGGRLGRSAVDFAGGEEEDGQSDRKSVV